jgi:hypothetical protein
MAGDWFELCDLISDWTGRGACLNDSMAGAGLKLDGYTAGPDIWPGKGFAGTEGFAELAPGFSS